MSLDLFGTLIEGYIETFDDAQGKDQTFRLWTDSGTGDPNLDPGELACLSYVTDVTIKIAMGKNSTVALTLNPPFDQGIKLLNSRILQWGVGHLVVTIGYTTGSEGRTTLPYGGLIQKPSVKIGRDIQMTINALGVGYAMNLTEGLEGKDFGAVSPAEAVEAVLKHYYLKNDIRLAGAVTDYSARGDDGTPLVKLDRDRIYPDMPKSVRDTHKFFQPIPMPVGSTVEPTEPKKPGKSSSPSGKSAARADRDAEAWKQYDLDMIKYNKDWMEWTTLNNKIANGTVEFKHIQQGTKNDWWFVYDLVRQNGLELSVIDQNVTIRDPDEWKKSAPVAIFLLRGVVVTNASPPILPLLEFSTDSTVPWLFAGVGKMVAKSVDDNGKKTEVTVTDSVAKGTRIGSDAAPNTESPSPCSDKPMAAGKSLPLEPSAATMTGAISEYKLFNNISGLKVEVTSIGVPFLEPGTVVQLGGIGKSFDGLYGVTEVEHKIGRAGFVTKFVAISNFRPTWANTDAYAKGAVKEEPAKPVIAGYQKERMTINESY